MTDKIDFETDPPITPIKTVGFVNLKAGAAMTRDAELKALVQKWREPCPPESMDHGAAIYFQALGKCADELEAALALPEDSGWQPIETAPKDGTTVDLWTSIGREPEARFNAKRNRWEVFGLDGFDTMNWVDVDGKPTHWTHLHAPPKDGE